MLAGVSISSNVDGKWTDPKPVTIENDYNYNEKANYFLSNTRKSLLMSIEREDSRGGRDLYVSFAKNDSLWAEPLNLGSVLNTAGEESAPFLASDDKTLYFSSNGFSGYGGSDVYMSRRLDDTWTNWSPPENLGPEINSKQDDLFFNIPANSNVAYYSRGITKDNADVFKVKMPIILSPDAMITVRGKLIDSKTGEPIGARIIYERLPEGKEVGVTNSDPKTGEYEIKLPGGYVYGFRAEAKDHLSENQSLDLREAKQNGSVKEKDIAMRPIDVTAEVATINVTEIEEKATIRLNNIFFDFDKAVLRPESYPELDRIAALMKERITLHVEIAGHTDTIGASEYNLKLSERRSKAVTRYLQEKGIDNARIVGTFFGESKPVDTSNTKAGNRKNRRVEFKIIKL
jgi:Outer membrane protein and related peptidoglycan-associated (lipo)proteins